MTDDQFKELMEKLEKIQRTIDAGQFFQPRTYPPYQQPQLPSPYFLPAWPANPIVTD